MYNMSALRKELGTATTSHEIPPNPSSNPCRKCGQSFNDGDDLKKHLRTAHKTYRPCNKFSPIDSENKCSYKDKCDFSHDILEPGTMMCWDCGNKFTNKNNVIIHRKQIHNVSIICRNMKTPAGCDRSDEMCGYLHPRQQSVQANSEADQSVNNQVTVEDFQKATPKKAIPLKVTKTSEEMSNKMEGMIIKMISSIQDQNKTMMELILSLQKN